MPLSSAQIASATGSSPEAVERNWPVILHALDEFGINMDLVQVAVAATVAVETAFTFEPIQERGGNAYFTRLYKKRVDLGNVLPGDGARYHGRGFVQLTGRANYRKVGNVLGVPLEESPDLALDPVISARALARYFGFRGVAAAANAKDWRRTRLLVNGGYNAWDEYNRCVCAPGVDWRANAPLSDHAAGFGCASDLACCAFSPGFREIRHHHDLGPWAFSIQGQRPLYLSSRKRDASSIGHRSPAR